MFSNLKTLFCFNLKIRLSDEEREKNTRDADYDLEMRELTCKEDKLARDLEHKTETIADQDRQLVKMKELVDSVITEITIAENKVRDKTSENQDLLAEQDLARRQIGDLRSQVQNLLNENKEVLDQKSAVESIFEEKMKEASEIQKLECSKLREEAIRVSSLLASQQEKLEQQSLEIESLHSQHHEEQARLKDLHVLTQDELARFAQEKYQEKFVKEKKRLESDMERLQQSAALANKQVEDAFQEKEQRMRADHEREVASYQKQIEDVARSLQVEHADGVNGMKQSLIDDYNQKLSKARQQEKDTIEQFEQDRQRLMDQIKLLTAELDGAKSGFDKVTLDLDNAKQELRELSIKSSTQSSEERQKEELQESLQTLKSSHASEVMNLQNEIISLKQEMESARQQFDATAQQVQADHANELASHRSSFLDYFNFTSFQMISFLCTIFQISIFQYLNPCRLKDEYNKEAEQSRIRLEESFQEVLSQTKMLEGEQEIRRLRELELSRSKEIERLTSLHEQTLRELGDLKLERQEDQNAHEKLVENLRESDKKNHDELESARDEMLNLDKLNMNLGAELTELKNEIDSKDRALEASQSDLKKLEEQVVEGTANLEELRAFSEDSRQQCRRLDQENEQLQIELDKAKQEREKITSTLEKAREEIGRQAEGMEAVKNTKKDTHKNLTSENEKLKEQIEDFRNQLTKKLEASLTQSESLTLENDKLHAELDKFREKFDDENQELRQQKNELEGIVNQLKQEFDVLNSKLLQNETENSEKIRQMEASEDFAAQLTDQLEVSEGRVRRLEEDLKNQKEKTKIDVQRLGAEKMQLFDQQNSQKVELEAAKKSLFELKKSSAEIVELGQVKAELATVRKDLSDHRELHGAYISLQEENSRLKSAENLPAPSGPPLSLIQIWQVVFAIWFRFWFVRFGN